MNKKVKKGFTLIELLGTIVVLGIIVTIVIVAITSIINTSKKKTYVLSETNILSTALTYAKENSGSFYSDDGSDIEYQCITVQELIDLGYFKKDITDSVIEFNNGTLNIDPDMRIYVDRNLETKVYGEGHLIKGETDELNLYCKFIDLLRCPDIESFNGTYDGESHTITLNNLNEELTVNYKTSPTDSWNETKPERTNAGDTQVFVQIENQIGQHKYCSNGNINISKKEVAVAWSGGSNFTYTGGYLGPIAEADTGTGETIELTSSKFKEVGTHTSVASCVSVDGDSTKCNNFNLTNTTMNFTIEVEVKVISLPTNAYCISRTYNGEEQELTTEPGEGFTFKNNRQTNAGQYQVTASLDENYIWENATTEDKTFTCTINKKDLILNWSNTTYFDYNGKLQGPTATANTGVSGETMTINTSKYKNIGEHTSEASCTGVNNDLTKCDNYNLTNKTQTFYIVEPTIVVDIPTNTYCVSRTYNGSEQTLTNTPATGYTFSNNKGTNADTYTITASLNENYIWSDATYTDKTFTCSISKKDISVTWSGGTSFTYNGSLQGPTATAETGTGETIELTSTKYKSVGTHTSTASCVKVDNDPTKCDNFNLTDKTMRFTINKKTYYLTFDLNGFVKMISGGVTLYNNITLSCEVEQSATSCEIIAPVLTDGYWERNSVTYASGSSVTVNEDLNGATLKAMTSLIKISKPTDICETKSYNGSLQTITKSAGSGYTFVNNEQTNAGTYTITVKLINGYIWNDDTTSDLSFECSLQAKTVETSWSDETEFVYTGSQIGPTASVSTGITSETMSVSSTKEIDRGTYTSEASCQSVTGGGSSCDNYELTNNTKEYSIKRMEYYKRECQKSTGYYCTSGQVLEGKMCFYNQDYSSTSYAVCTAQSDRHWVSHVSKCYKSWTSANACSIGVCNCSTWGSYTWSTTDCGNKNERTCQVEETRLN